MRDLQLIFADSLDSVLSQNYARGLCYSVGMGNIFIR